MAYYIAAMPQDRRPKRVLVHSANRDGARRIKAILDGKVKELIRHGVYGEIF